MKSDETLIRESAAGDRESFGILVSRYGPLVLSLCRGYARDPAAAEDMAQEVFLRTWLKAGSFRGNSLFSTWLYRVAVNVALNYRRRRTPDASLDEPAHEGGETDASRIPAPESDRPDISWQREENSRLVMEEIRRLPDRQRTALILTASEQRSYRETAEIMGMTVSSIESLVFRARRNLRRSLSRGAAGNPAPPAGQDGRKKSPPGTV